MVLKLPQLMTSGIVWLILIAKVMNVKFLKSDSKRFPKITKINLLKNRVAKNNIVKN